ncbi:MAG: isoaspartyl peptidase/L-asparaginase [Candidatus Hodarchaeota archaeon]
MDPAIIVHGGAWNIPDSLKEDHLIGVVNSVNLGYNILKKGGSALNAVEKSVVNMENDPVFDAGIGSFLNEKGFVELDALIIDGSTLEIGSIGAVHNCKNPVTLARKLLERSSYPMMLVGQGADLFAEEIGLNIDSESLIIPREYKRWKEGKRVSDIFTPTNKGTVGAVALDKKGKLASATSTGGPPYKKVGRLGDTPLIGCGGYANQYAAACSTGHGESFMKLVAAKLATEFVESGDMASNAAKRIIEKIASINGYGGIIVVDRNGNIGYHFNTVRMAYALIGQDGKLISGIDSV